MEYSRHGSRIKSGMTAFRSGMTALSSGMTAFSSRMTANTPLRADFI